MAPGYRNNTPSRRQNRGLIDHDIFEGLPVRNWRRDIVVVAPPPAHSALNEAADKWDVELPWGMPKDHKLMPQHSQDLLAAARSGKLYQKRPLVEEDHEDDSMLPDKPEKKEAEPKDDGFTVRTWKLMPKHLEGPEFEYLAKRRKGLRGAAIPGAAPAPTMTKMTVRKTDDQGNAYIEHVVVPEGQAVEGEVIAQTVVTDAAAVPGVAEPLKRRPPPPKRKAKGPGRGRKKKVMLAPTSVPAGADATPTDGQAALAPKVEGALGDDGVKKEATTTPLADNEDTEMGDGSQVPSDEEGEDGDEGSEDDDQEEGEIIDEDQEREDEEAKRRAEQERERLIKANNSMESKLPEKPAIADFSMDTPGGAFSSHRMSQSRDREFGGSPLKNTFTPRSYSPSVHDPEAEAEGDEDEDEEPHNGRPSHRNSPFVFQTSRQPSDELQHHPEILPNTASTVEEATEIQEHDDGGFQSMLEGTSPDNMLLDGGDNSQDTVLAQPHVAPDASFGQIPENETPAMDDGEIKEDENFEDLLGGLEEHLNEHEAAASANLLSRDSSVPEVVSMSGDGEEKGEQKTGEDMEVDRLTPAQDAPEVSSASPSEEKAQAVEPETKDEAPVHEEEAAVQQVDEKIEESVNQAATAEEVPPEETKEDEAVLGDAESISEAEKKDVQEDVKPEAAA